MCNFGGHIVARHDRLRDELANATHEALETVVHTEQNDGRAEDDRRPDFHFINSRGITEHVDTMVVTPHARTRSGDTRCGRAGVAIATAENVKRRKYSHPCLTPAIWSHLGRPGDDLVAFVRALAVERTEAARSQTVAGIWQDLSCALQKQNCLILSTAGALCPPQ